MKGRLKFRRPFVVLAKKKTGGENFLKKVFSPRPLLSKTFDVIESLFIAFLILTASGSPPDFFVGKEMLIIRPVFEDRGFYAVSIPDKKARPIIQLGLPFRENCKQGFDKGESLGREGGGERETFSRKFPSPLPHIYCSRVPFPSST